MNKILLLLILNILILSANTQPLQKIKLQLQWKHQFEFAGFYMAKEKGFYADMGLDVEFIEYKNSTDITQEVLDGNAQYGVTYASIIAQYLNGKPIVILANFFKQSPLVLVAQKSIETPANLKDKRVMGVSSGIDSITLTTMLDKFKVSSSDIKNIEPSFDINDFIEKKVDAMAVFTTNELYELDRRGVKYNIFDPTTYGTKYYDVNLFTTQKEARDNPKRAKNFRDASIKGWEYALKHQDEAVALILKKYNTQNRTKEALSFEAKQIEQIMLPTVYPIGSIDEFRIKVIADNFIQSGFVNNTKNRSLNKLIFGHIDKNLDLIKLTENELLYLQTKEVIKICVDPNWMPFEKIENGKYIGMASDYIKLFSQKINTPIKLVETISWSKSLLKIKNRECDILPMAEKTASREKYMNFTSAYINMPIVVASKVGNPFVEELEQIKDKKLGVVKGYSLLEKFKNFNLVEVDSIADGLEKVKKGKLFGYLDNSIVINYEIQNNYLSILTISGKFEEIIKLSVASRDDEPILNDIFQKVILSIDNLEKQKILNRWVNISDKDKTNHTLIWKILIFFSIIFILFTHKQSVIKKLNSKLQDKIDKEIKKSRDKDRVIFQQNKLISMGEMIENIAHQWRQPLSQINSAVLIVDDELYNQKVENHLIQEKLDEIEKMTKYMSNTIDDFKNFYAQDKTKELFSLKDSVKISLSLVKASFKYHRIEISINIDKDIKITGFKNEFQQSILVILNNAKDILISKKIQNPKISINLKTTNSLYILSICDNGGGIKDDIICKIFDPYFTTKHKAQGTGLGLYLSKMILEESMHNKFYVKNIDDGVCFYIEFNKESKIT